MNYDGINCADISIKLFFFFQHFLKNSSSSIGSITSCRNVSSLARRALAKHVIRFLVALISSVYVWTIAFLSSSWSSRWICKSVIFLDRKSICEGFTLFPLSLESPNWLHLFYGNERLRIAQYEMHRRNRPTSFSLRHLD